MRWSSRHIVLTVSALLAGCLVLATLHLTSWTHGFIKGSVTDIMKRTLTMIECHSDLQCYASTYAPNAQGLEQSVMADLQCASSETLDWASTFDVTSPEGMAKFIAYFDKLMLYAPAKQLEFIKRSDTHIEAHFILGRIEDGPAVVMLLEDRNGVIYLTGFEGLCEALKCVAVWTEKSCAPDEYEARAH